MARSIAKWIDPRSGLEAHRAVEGRARPKPRRPRRYSHLWWRPVRRAVLTVGAAALVVGLGSLAQRVSAFDPASGIDFLIGRFPWFGFILESVDPARRLVQPHLYATVFSIAFASVWIFLGTRPGRAVMRCVWPEAPPFLDWPIPRQDPFDPFSRTTPFVGRDEAMRQLRRFAGAPGALLWYGVCGRCGIGKTRLAIEWLYALEASARRPWDVGVLRRPFAWRDLEGWRPRRPTAIIIDEAAAEHDLWLLVKVLATHSSQYRQPVRILLVDSAPLRPQGTADEVSAGLAHRWKYTRDEPSSVPVRTSAVSSSHQPILALGPLASADHVAAVVQYLSPYCSTGSAARDLYIRSEGNPFLAMLLGSPESKGVATPADILALKAEHLIDQAARALGRTAALKLLSVAALAGPVPALQLSNLAPEAGDIQTLAALFPDAAAQTLRREVPALRPELIAREVLIRSLSQLQDNQVRETIDTAFAANAAAACRFIAGLWRHRPERSLAYALKLRTLEEGAVMLTAENERAARVLIMLAEQGELRLGSEGLNRAKQEADVLPAEMAEGFSADDLSGPDGGPLEETAIEWRGGLREVKIAALRPYLSGMRAEIAKRLSGNDLSAVDEAVAALEEIAAVWPFEFEIQLCRAVGARNATVLYGARAQWGDMTAAIARTEETAGLWPNSERMQFERAAGAVNAIFCCGEWSDVVAAIARLEQAAGAWPNSEDIQHERAKGLVNASNRCGQFARWDHMASTIARIEEIAGTWVNSEKIQHRCASGAATSIVFHCRNARWGDAAAAITRLEETARAWPNSEGIQYQRATGNSNAILFYCENAQWGDAAAAIARLDETARTCPMSERIHICRALGISHAAFHYGFRARWDETASSIACLEDIADAWANSEKIQLCLGSAIRNAIGVYGKSLRWDEMASAIARLEDVADAWPNSDQIQLVQASGMLNAISSYGEHARWDQMEAAFARLDNIAGARPKSEEFQLVRALGAHDVLLMCSVKRLRADARRSLSEAARAFPVHSKIQYIAAQYSLNFTALVPSF
ncbi:MAG: hypothetical protein ACLQJR_08095 [Stellaceae bacterium]